VGPASPPSAERSNAAAWQVPLAVLLAVLIGALVAGGLRFSINPSGVVQNPLTTPLGEQLSTQAVMFLFGAPYAALTAALVSYAGLRRPYPLAYAAVGVLAGVVVFAIVGVSSLAIGQWWVSSVSPDTNRAAAVFTFLLVPPAALSAQLAVTSVPMTSAVPQRGAAARSVFVGILLGLILGSLLGSITAGLTWAINCPQTGYPSCFTLSSVVDSALLIGSIAGMAIGAVTGTISWLVRLRPTPG
jgi:hypothetical protein